MMHNEIDPYTPEGGYYECHACGTRYFAETAGTCQKCGSSEVRNISVPRE
jgi:hypothetical protein